MRLARETRVIAIPTRIAASDQGMPTLGQVAEEIRSVLKSKFGTYPPNLNTTMDPSGKIVIQAANPENGMSVEIQITNMAQSPPQTQMVPTNQPQAPIPPGGVLPSQAQQPPMTAQPGV